MKDIYRRNKKTVVAVTGAAIAFATLVVTSPSDAITSSEWLSGAIGLATALGVYQATNEDVEG